MGYWRPDFELKETDFICVFRVTSPNGVDPDVATAIGMLHYTNRIFEMTSRVSVNATIEDLSTITEADIHASHVFIGSLESKPALAQSD